MRGNLRDAIRALRQLRGLAVVAVVTLGVGIGATTAMFSVVYAALLRPLPFEAPDRLVALSVIRETPRSGRQRTRWSEPEIAALQASMTSLEAIGSFSQATMNLTSGSGPERIVGEVASPGYFRVLDVVATRGRTFVADDDATPGGHPVAIISATLWRERFAADPAVLGRSIVLNDVPLTIVGVLPVGFAGLSGRATVWLPPTMAPSVTYADYLTTPQHFISVIGRLKPGASIAAADAELAVMAAHVVRPEPTAEPARWSASAWSLGRARIDPDVERSLLVLLAAVCCVLLITCLNVASLLLARARTRRREMALRLAVGASRGRVVSQLLTESALLAALGGALGIVLTEWAVSWLPAPSVMASARNGYAQIGSFATPRVDGMVWFFALAITLGTSVLFGLSPARELARPDLVDALKEDGRSGAGPGRTRTLARLVVGEVALAVILLTGAGLFLKSFAALEDLRGGFSTAGVLTFWVTPPASRYPSGPDIVERLLTRVQQVPGVLSAAVNRCVPFNGCARTTLAFPDRPMDPARLPVVGRHYVSSEYLRTLSMELRMGRWLTDADRPGRPPVTVISETAARAYWPGENPLGKHVWFGPSTGFTDRTHPVEVVGVVGDVTYGIADVLLQGDFYTSYLQFVYPDSMFIVKTAQPAQTLVSSLRAAVASIDPGLPIYDVQTLEERIDAAVSRPRLNASVVAGFAVAATVLAALGVYGVMAYSVSSRRREIGVRLALGADSGRLIRLVLGESLRLASLGATIGLLAALAGMRLVRSLLFGVSPTDPVILTAVVTLIVTTVMLAASVPARRAGAVDPVTVLRGD
jgi:putative ABC transport system permease protein